MRFLFAAIAVAGLAVPFAAAHAKDIQYRQYVTLAVGQSTILKGVRTRCDGATAPSWAEIRGRLPKSKTGRFSDGGAGTVDSKSCKGRVPARAVKFTATKQGRETLVIFNDGTRVTVK